MKSTWHIKIILSNLIYLPSLWCSIFNHLLLYFIIINLAVIYLSSAAIIYHLFIYQSYLPNYPLSSYLPICALLSLLLYIYMLYYVKYVPCMDQQIVRKRGRWERCSSSFGITLTQFFWLWNISLSHTKRHTNLSDTYVFTIQLKKQNHTRSTEVTFILLYKPCSFLSSLLSPPQK